MRKIYAAAAAVLSAAMLCSCSADVPEEVTEEEEDTPAQTLTVDDPDYYTRFKGQNISINVYNWGEYICTGADEGTLNVNAEFTNLTGIKVNYTNYATNEELYAKLKGGGASYDIIIPSDYMINKMIKEKMVQKLDYENIPNFKYIMPNFRNLEYDPENEYSVPYTWGTVGIIYDETMIDIPPEDIDWDILWNEDYLDNILMFDNPRDAFAIAEIKCGYSLNTEDSDELIKAADELKAQKRIVQAYVMDEIFDKMGAGDALIAPYYAGDALTIMRRTIPSISLFQRAAPTFLLTQCAYPLPPSRRKRRKCTSTLCASLISPMRTSTTSATPLRTREHLRSLTKMSAQTPYPIPMRISLQIRPRFS